VCCISDYPIAVVVSTVAEFAAADILEFAVSQFAKSFVVTIVDLAVFDLPFQQCQSAIR
jgi:hypothetical protein